ncbi:MAG: hypothetical protein QUU85_19525, partial [Candidatus Eisenbacteria bacterium]|nr:hypothetical protein [Candidatus Eisenbacteria bacterium]
MRRYPLQPIAGERLLGQKDETGARLQLGGDLVDPGATEHGETGPRKPVLAELRIASGGCQDQDPQFLREAGRLACLLYTSDAADEFR